MKIRLLLLPLFAVLLNACHDGSVDVATSSGVSPSTIQAEQDKCTNTPANGHDIRYVFSRRDCTTGCQMFSSWSEACDTVLRDSVNNDCARTDREEYYAENCSSDGP